MDPFHGIVKEEEFDFDFDFTGASAAGAPAAGASSSSSWSQNNMLPQRSLASSLLIKNPLIANKDVLLPFQIISHSKNLGEPNYIKV